MGWLDDLAKLWSKKPGEAPTGNVPAGHELIRLPHPSSYAQEDGWRSYLAGNDERWISSLVRGDDVQVINLGNGNRMWRHGGGHYRTNDFIISTAGITPKGNLDYCANGGCQYRAFANAGGLQQHVDEIEQEYLGYADWLNDAQRQEMTGRFWHAGTDMMDPFAFARGFTYDAKRFPESKTYLEDAISGLTNGVILANTGRDALGLHLVAIRDGLQVVPSPGQLLWSTYSRNDPERNKWLSRHLTQRMRQFEQEHGVSFGKAGTRSWNKFEKYVDGLPQGDWFDVWEQPTEVLRVYEAPR